MITPEEQIGKIAQADGKFYTPKYWVAKFKTDTDVIIETASKSLMDCQIKTENLYPRSVEEEQIVYITVQLTNVNSQ